MNNRYICPQCGGESVIETRRKINPRTGRVYKKIEKAPNDSESGNEGIACKECGWCFNTISYRGTDGINIPYIFEHIDPNGD